MQAPGDVLRKGLIHILGRQELWEAFARHHNIPDLPLVQGLKTDSSNVALEMAIAGLGCAVTLASLAEVHVKRGSLVEPFPGKIASGWGYDLHVGDLSPTRASDASAITVACCTMSSRCTRSTTSMLEWCVVEKYSSGS